MTFRSFLCLFRLIVFIWLVLPALNSCRGIATEELRTRHRNIAHNKPASPWLCHRRPALWATVIAIPLLGVILQQQTAPYEYDLQRVDINLPNLPKELEGLKIGHFSDVHLGCFYKVTDVAHGIDRLLQQEPDVIFFTGDLIENHIDEITTEQKEVLQRLKAPLGVYSILGNHDYGDYARCSQEDKRSHFERMIALHHSLGWHLLRNSHEVIKYNYHNITVIGSEYWGACSLAFKYGNLSKALQGVENAALKLLLTHDPSHWSEEVIPIYPSINVTFSGHTHGLPFVLEPERISLQRLNPVCMLPHYEGLHYQAEKSQHLYVSRGFGRSPYVGRVGVKPEVAILTLRRA